MVVAFSGLLNSSEACSAGWGGACLLDVLETVRRRSGKWQQRAAVARSAVDGRCCDGAIDISLSTI